jgi:hypothetical protein
MINNIIENCHIMSIASKSILFMPIEVEVPQNEPTIISSNIKISKLVNESISVGPMRRAIDINQGP